MYQPLRKETRKEIYQRLLSEKGGKRVTIPNSSFCVPNLQSEQNIGVLIRSAVAFGIESCFIIGKNPPYREMRRISCGMIDLINIKTFPNPSEFLEYSRNHNLNVVALEKTDTSKSLEPIKEDNTCFCLGHETFGVPVEILFKAKEVYHIDMVGPLNSINVGVAGAIAFNSFLNERKSG